MHCVYASKEFEDWITNANLSLFMDTAINKTSGNTTHSRGPCQYQQ